MSFLEKTNGSSETIRAFPFQKLSNIPNKRKSPKANTGPIFYSWVSGLIDGDGSFNLSKKGYGSCEIILSSKGLTNLLLKINGELRLKKRVEKYQTLCKVYDVSPVSTCSLSTESAWYAGFFAAEGHFNLNANTFQLSLTVSQKDLQVLESIKQVFGGNIYYDKGWDGWVYSVSHLKDLELQFRYLSLHRLGSPKEIQLRRFKRLALYKERKYHLEKDGPRKTRFFRLVKTFIEEGATKTDQEKERVMVCGKEKVEKDKDRVQLKKEI